MKVFNTFVKIAKKNKFTVLLYIIIFLVIATFATGSGDQTQITSFTPERLPIAVIDRDLSQTSIALRDYLGKIHSLVDVKDDKEVFQDELYYRNVSNILIIPENFEQELIAGNHISLESIEVPNSMYSIYLNMQLEQILNTLKVYLSCGVNANEAMSHTIELVSKETPVNIQVQANSLEKAPDYSFFYQYMSYVLLAVIASTLGMILLAFNSEDLRKRTICSALPLKKRNAQLTLACAVTSIFIWIILNIVPFILYQDAMLKGSTYGYYLINTFTFLLISISMGFLIGTIGKTEDHVTIYSTTLPLVLSFLGGVFVPLSIMSEKVLYFCRFIPTYWYVTNNTMLGKTLKLSAADQKEFWFGILIQVCFAVVIFGITLIVTKRKNEKA